MGDVSMLNGLLWISDGDTVMKEQDQTVDFRDRVVMDFWWGHRHEGTGPDGWLQDIVQVSLLQTLVMSFQGTCRQDATKQCRDNQLCVLSVWHSIHNKHVSFSSCPEGHWWVNLIYPDDVWDCGHTLLENRLSLCHGIPLCIKTAFSKNPFLKNDKISQVMRSLEDNGLHVI